MEQMQDICRGLVGPLERTQGSATRPNSQIFCLIGKPNMFFPSFLNRFSYFLHKMKIKHRIIGEYATKRCFFDIKKLTIDTGS
jgi:hypothetical protein